MLHIMTNVRLFVGGGDLTAETNQVEPTYEADSSDVTTFASEGWREVMARTKSASISARGFWEAGDPGAIDDIAFVGLGGVGPWTVAPQGAADGALAYVGEFMSASYSPISGGQNEVAGFELEGRGSGSAARGVIVHPPGTARVASGTGAAANLGAVVAGRRLAATLHVLSVSGTASITARLETDDAVGFPSPTTRLTFAAVNAGQSSGQLLRTDGTAITDTFQRLAWTITGTGSVLFVSAVSIVA